MIEATNVVVVGGNTAGCAAAIAAARSGCRVWLLEPSASLGGINSAGVFGFDAASPQALSGIAEEVAARINTYYAQSTLADDPVFSQRQDQVWESHVAARIWKELVDEHATITTMLGAVPTGVSMERGRIKSIQWKPACDLSGGIRAEDDERVLAADVFIDASYEGDVAAWSGAEFSVGREARSWHEPHAGVVYTNNLSPSVDGWLPNSILPGSSGAASPRIMAFASRLHCRIYDDVSPGASHLLKEPPPGYDARNYAWSPVGTDSAGKPAYFNMLYVLVNGKYCLNRLVRGNNLAAISRAYIEAAPDQRSSYYRQFVDYALGYLHYIQTEGGYPQLGLAWDEFEDNGNVPYRIYVRDGRRIHGLSTLRESDLNPFIVGDGMRPPMKQDAVAIGDWMFESHGCVDEIEPGRPNPEGFFFNRVARAPYQIPYGCLLTAKVDNLIVAGPISATHVAFCAFRTESTRLQIGIAAGVAAGLSLRQKKLPREIAVEDIQTEILSRRGKLVFYSDVESWMPHFEAIQWAGVRGYVPSDEDWRFFPQKRVTWADLVEAVVRTLHLPISVSGRHFEHVPRSHPGFRYFEAVYDFGSARDIDFFGAKTLKADLFLELLRLDANARLIPLRPDDLVAATDGVAFLTKLAAAFGSEHRPEIEPAADALGRGAMCAALQALFQARPQASNLEFSQGGDL